MTTPVHQSVPHMMVQTDPIGWHLRQVAVLVRTAGRFTSNIIVECCGRSASAKSVIAILGLIAEANGILYIKATGPDACEAIHAITSECL